MVTKTQNYSIRSTKMQIFRIIRHILNYRNSISWVWLYQIVLFIKYYILTLYYYFANIYLPPLHVNVVFELGNWNMTGNVYRVLLEKRTSTSLLHLCWTWSCSLLWPIENGMEVTICQFLKPMSDEALSVSMESLGKLHFHHKTNTY